MKVYAILQQTDDLFRKNAVPFIDRYCASRRSDTIIRDPYPQQDVACAVRAGRAKKVPTSNFLADSRPGDPLP
jgi:hypothetical protein